MKEKVRARGADDMLAAFLITYVTAAFRFEKHMPESFMRVFNGAVFIVFSAAWLWLCFRNGRRCRAAFPVFAAVFWLLPLLIIFLYNSGPELFRFSIIMYVLSEFLDFLIFTPTGILGGIFGISSAYALALMIIMCAAAYMCGIFSAMDRGGNYT